MQLRYHTPETNSDAGTRLDVLTVGLVRAKFQGANRSRENAASCRFGNAAVGCCRSATVVAKSIPRAGNVRYHTVDRAARTRVGNAARVQRDAEWHPKRATSRATDTV